MPGTVFDRTMSEHELQAVAVGAPPTEGWLSRVFNRSLNRALAWGDATIANPVFQRWAARFPLTRPIARRRSRALFDLMAGFVYSQALRACVELDLFSLLAVAPLTPLEISARTAVPVEALERLLSAAVALRLLERRTAGRVGLGSLGAAMANNDALRALVTHHILLYDDLRDPVALLRGKAQADTALARYYPYSGTDSLLLANEVEPYSALMSATAGPLITEVLDAYSFEAHGSVLDIGGGEGRFSRSLSERWPHLDVAMLDLPAVAERARQANAEAKSRVRVRGGDFRTDPLPSGFEVITLVRILLDHDDRTVLQLLTAIRAALAPGGRLLIAEPMSGVRGARNVGDAYFSLYLFAMGSGRARSQPELERMCQKAGFSRCRSLPTYYPVSTGILVAEV